MVRSSIAVLVAVLIAGCSLVNPFVITREVREGGPPIKTKRITDPSRPDYSEASQYAARVKERYRQALGDQAKLQSWLGIGLIPLSAAAIGLGATGGNPEAVLALALTGAAAFGTGSWLIHRPRQAAYVAGIKAVTCAEDAVTPLGLTEREIEQFSTDLEGLADSIGKVEKQAAGVASLTDRFEGKVVAAIKVPAERGHYAELIKEARDEVAAAKSLVTTGDAALVTGTELKRVVATIGRRLAIAIDKIVDVVDGMIVETQRDLQALSTIISGLGGTYKTLTAVPEGLKRAGTAEKAPGPQADVRGVETETVKGLTTDAEQLTEALRVLRERSTDLSRAIRRVSTVVNTVSKDAPLKALEGCGVKSTDIVIGLTVDPAEPFTVKKPGSVGFVAKGGVFPYTAAVRGPSDGVTVTQSAPFTPAFAVTASKDAQVGTYVVSIFDGSGQIKPVEVSVTDGAPAPVAPPVAPGTTTPVASLARFVERVKGQSIPVSDTGVTLKVGEPKIEQGKVNVPAEVEKVEGFKPDAFTREAVIDALQKRAAGSGASVGDIVVDFDALKKAAEEKAKLKPAAAAAISCEGIAFEKSVKPDAEPTFSALPKHLREKLQVGLCLKKKPGKDDEVDGIWGPQTKHRLKEHQCRAGRPPDGKLTEALVQELLRPSDDEIKKQCQGR